MRGRACADVRVDNLIRVGVFLPGTESEATMKIPGAGNYDTSDLPNGTSGRANDTYGRPKAERIQSLTRPSRILGGNVKTIESDTLNGYHVTINKYERGGNKPWQVFVYKPDYSDGVSGSCATQDEVAQFIADNT